MGAAEPVRRTVVKVCGITRLADARAALDAGADWLGFIVHGESPRRVDAGAAADIIAALPGVTAVAVLVEVGPDEALRLGRRIGAARVQLHRVDPTRWPNGFPLPVTFAVPVTAEGRLVGKVPALRDLLLLDRAHETRAGGTGETFAWEAAAALAARRPVMLAGGLDDGNVADALDRMRPYGVDASSRLELSPGIKDPERVLRFVAAVRAHDARARAAS